MPEMPEIPDLHIDNLCYGRGGAQLLNAVDLRCDSAGITALLGHNGAGKSLLLRAMHGLIRPDSGTIWWNGQPATSIGPRRQQSLVAQQPVLLRRSVYDNIKYVLRLRDCFSQQRCNDLLSQAGLQAHAAQPARSLSGGQQQRLSIARALATEPKVLMLDEPCASLDPESTASIEAMIINAATKSKVFLVTHDLAQAARLASDIVFLQRGSVAEYSSADAFFSQPASTAGRTYLHSQTQLRSSAQPTSN